MVHQEAPLDRTAAGDLVLLLSEDGKRFLIRLNPEVDLQTHRGVLPHQKLIGLPYGSRVETHLGTPFMLFRPSLRDLLLQTKRRTQIMYPKDIGYVLLRLSVRPGGTVLEAGTGSGALTTALAWAVGEEGKVYSYDRREEMQALARRNLQRLGLEHRVEFKVRDLAEGFDERDMEAVFLDLPNPEDYLEPARTALAPGGQFGALVPTANQVSRLLERLPQHRFAAPEVCEILLRFYKPVAERLRPEDRMVAHTGYLIFARPTSP
jgi:tRNA (adenine57-N1/adenine58-N1)-methyltransferase